VETSSSASQLCFGSIWVCFTVELIEKGNGDLFRWWLLMVIEIDW
jgi:hypothetical protein